MCKTKGGLTQVRLKSRDKHARRFQFSHSRKDTRLPVVDLFRIKIVINQVQKCQSRQLELAMNQVSRTRLGPQTSRTPLDTSARLQQSHQARTQNKQSLATTIEEAWLQRLRRLVEMHTHLMKSTTMSICRTSTRCSQHRTI